MKHKQQSGIALILGLIFLLILTILGISGMRMARLELLMAGNEQFYVQALAAAEAAVEVQIAAANFQTTISGAYNNLSAGTPTATPGTSTIEYINQGPAPDGGFSDDVMTLRYQIEATGLAPAGQNVRSTVKLMQGLYVLAPGN